MSVYVHLSGLSKLRQEYVRKPPSSQLSHLLYTEGDSMPMEWGGVDYTRVLYIVHMILTEALHVAGQSACCSALSLG